ncbi:MAG TPA: DUF2795 domain-containing protein [Ktedonobacteraceae bacterium]|nr:DUF2795 domain-containing protein [Ktedonobacteraceae bacterium]
MSMYFDSKLFNQILRTIPYPVSKVDLIEMARQNSIDENLISDLEALLPDKTFNSANEALDLLPKWEG